MNTPIVEWIRNGSLPSPGPKPIPKPGSRI